MSTPLERAAAALEAALEDLDDYHFDKHGRMHVEALLGVWRDVATERGQSMDAYMAERLLETPLMSLEVRRFACWRCWTVLPEPMEDTSCPECRIGWGNDPGKAMAP